jgi:hypothetical protein
VLSHFCSPFSCHDRLGLASEPWLDIPSPWGLWEHKTPMLLCPTCSWQLFSDECSNGTPHASASFCSRLDLFALDTHISTPASVLTILAAGCERLQAVFIPSAETLELPGWPFPLLRSATPGQPQMTQYERSVMTTWLQSSRQAHGPTRHPARK